MKKQRFTLIAIALCLLGVAGLYAAETWSKDGDCTTCAEETTCPISWCPWGD